MDNFSFDGRNLEDLAKNLRESADLLRDEVDKTVAKIAGEIFEEAKELVGHHSQSIPGSMKLRMIPGAAIITAGGRDAPLAALYELGNKGTKTTSRAVGVWFKHPTFGHGPWDKQRRYPFLRPTLDVNRREITKQMESAWEEALRPLKLE